MTVISVADLFGSSGIPINVVESISTEPTGAIVAESVKVIFILEGWAEVRSRNEAIAATTGTILTVPAGVECSGLPVARSRAITFYVHPEYLADQVRWLARTHPLVHQLHRTISGDAGLQRLQVSDRAMHTMGSQLIRLARLPRRQEHEFAMFSLASDVFDSVGRFAGVTPQRLSDDGPTLGRPRDEVIAAVDLMRDHLGRNWRMDTLAREVALSASQLARACLP